MNTGSQPALRLTTLKQLLADSERDLVALSREEADRILAIPDRETRLRAYLQLREDWSEGGDRLLPEDEGRIQDSLAIAPSALEVPPPPPSPRLPLTPLALLSWAETWRYALIESALRRGPDHGLSLLLADLEKLLQRGSDPQVSAIVPEIGLVRQVDALVSELREGLDNRQLLPNEALSGQVENLTGLLRAVTSLRARRHVVVPPAPSTPSQRVTIAELLGWFGALMTFEEAVGARALMQAGVAREPDEARARFTAAARGNFADVENHAGPQLISWRKAERMHRACYAAIHGGWLVRERMVTLPSFDVDELEQWFGFFADGLPLLPVPPSPATPHSAYRWWLSRRTHVLRATALTLLAEGALRVSEDVEAAAATFIDAQPGLFRAEAAVLGDVRKVIPLCEQILQEGRVVSPVIDCTGAEGLVRAWSPSVQKSAHALPQERAAALPQPVSASQGIDVAQPDFASESRQDAGARVVSLGRRIGETISAFAVTVGTVTLFLVAGLLLVILYQVGSIGILGLEGGLRSVVNEAVLRSARLTEWRWVGAGVLLVVAVVVLIVDAGRIIAPRAWRFRLVCKWIAAASLAIVVWFVDPSSRFGSSRDGFAVWPERVLNVGGVPTSRLMPDEGIWFRRRVFEPLNADDLPAVRPGDPPLILLREVGLFGRTLGWFIANQPEVETIVSRPVSDFSAAPPISVRGGGAQ